MRKALLLYQELYHKELEKKKANFKNYEIIALNLDDNIFLRNLGSNVIFKEPQDYFSFSDLTKVDKTALHIAKNWYVSENKDLSLYQDISIGEVIQYEIMTYFVAILKSLALISKVIEREKIEEIFLFGERNLYEKAASIIGKNRNIKVIKCRNEPKKMDIEKINAKKHFKLIVIAVLINFHNLLIRRRLFSGKSYLKRNIFIVNSYRLPSLIKELGKNKRFFLTILVTGYIKELMKHHFFGKKNITLIKSYRLGDLFFKNEDKNFLIAKRIHKNSEENIRKKIKEIGIFGLRELIKNNFPPFIVNQIAKIIKNYRIVNSWVVKGKVDGIVVGQDFHEIQRLIVALGNARGIPTMTLQHGVYNFYPHHVSPISKVVGIWGKGWTNWFTDCLEVERERIKIIGEPFYDDFFQKKNDFNKNRFLNRYRIPEGKKIILYAYQSNVTTSALSFLRENERIAYKVCKTIGENKKYHMIFKLRPSDSIDKGSKIVKGSGAKNITVISKTDNLELLKVSDLIITRYSTMAFEGMLLGKPIIILNFYPLYRNSKSNLFLETSGVVKVNKEEDLLPTIQKILEDPGVKESLASGRKEFLKNYFYFGKNSSSQKTVECIRNLISG